MKRSLAALALAGLVAMPAGAQDMHMWDAERPDAVAPLNVRAALMLPASTFHFGYDYASSNAEGLQVGSQLIDRTEVLKVYALAPFERKATEHRISLGYGLSEYVSLMVTAGWLDQSRGQIDANDFFNFYESSGITDVMADLLFRLYEGDDVRSVFSLGFDLPTGSIDEEGTNLSGSTVVLPFDAQLGTGSVALRPGVSAQIQNEKATVGTRAEGRFYLNENDRGYQHGNGVDASLWASYMLSDYVAVSAGMDYARWGDFSGSDGALDRLDDPGQDPIFTAGTRVDLPVGVTLVMPEDGLFGGTAIQAQWFFPVHQDYDRPRLRADSAFRIGITAGFGAN